MPKLPNSAFSSELNRAERSLSVGKGQHKTMTVSFGHRQGNKLRPNQEGYVYMWLNYGKRRLAFSTGIKTRPGGFDPATGTVAGQAHKSTALNAMKHKAEVFATELKITNRPIDLQLIKAAVLGTYIETVPNLIECIHLFNSRVLSQSYELGELEKGSYDKLQVWNRHLIKWVKDDLGVNTRLDEVVPAEANHLLLWLKKNRNLSQNVACRVVAHLKRILNYAVENEWIIRNPFMNYKKKLIKRKLDYLTEVEVGRLETTKFASQALDQLRDVFLFQCYTSLSYNELRELTPDHISQVDGHPYIRISRKKTSGKTNIDQIIPLVPQAIILINRYKDHEICKRYGRCFPVQSNQKFNALLKQIAMVTGINKRLTSHMGRRTAATHYLKQGVPLVSVSAMLGHSNTKMTEDHYAHVQPEMVVKDFSHFLRKSS